MKSIYFAQNSGAGRFRREPERKHKINSEIRSPEVRLIDEEGKMVGVVKIKQAIEMSLESDLDLVEISPKAKPPVCKIINYGKFAYEIQKKEKQQRKHQQQQQMKEIRFKWRTATHDFNFKTRHAREFIKSGHKVKASVMFRGREITHREIGKELLERFIEAMSDIAKVDSRLRMEGKNMSVIMAPEKTTK